MDHRPDYKSKIIKFVKHTTRKKYLVENDCYDWQWFSDRQRNHEAKKKKNDELDFIQIRKHLLIENHSKENENPGHKLGENIVINKSENTLYSAYKKYIWKYFCSLSI